MSRWIKKFLPQMSQNFTDKPDNTDRFKFEPNMSPLSVRPSVRLDEKMENKPEPDISDKPDRLDPNLNMSSLSGSPQEVLKRISYPYGEQDFEERLAITEYDGCQNPMQAHRIAYLDAFISLLSTLTENDPHQDWLQQKIQTALATLETQNFPTLN